MADSDVVVLLDSEDEQRPHPPQHPAAPAPPPPAAQEVIDLTGRRQRQRQRPAAPPPPGGVIDLSGPPAGRPLPQGKVEVVDLLTPSGSGASAQPGDGAGGGATGAAAATGVAAALASDAESRPCAPALCRLLWRLRAAGLVKQEEEVLPPEAQPAAATQPGSPGAVAGPVVDAGEPAAGPAAPQPSQQQQQPSLSERQSTSQQQQQQPSLGQQPHEGAELLPSTAALCLDGGSQQASGSQRTSSTEEASHSQGGSGSSQSTEVAGVTVAPLFLRRAEGPEGEEEVEGELGTAMDVEGPPARDSECSGPRCADPPAAAGVLQAEQQQQPQQAEQQWGSAAGGGATQALAGTAPAAAAASAPAEAAVGMEVDGPALAIAPPQAFAAAAGSTPPALPGVPSQGAAAPICQQERPPQPAAWPRPAAHHAAEPVQQPPRPVVSAGHAPCEADAGAAAAGQPPVGAGQRAPAALPPPLQPSACMREIIRRLMESAAAGTRLEQRAAAAGGAVALFSSPQPPVAAGRAEQVPGARTGAPPATGAGTGAPALPPAGAAAAASAAAPAGVAAAAQVALGNAGTAAGAAASGAAAGAAAMAAGGAAAGVGAAEDGPAAPAQQPPAEPSNPAAMLQHLRSLIPADLQQQYAEPQAVDPADRAAAEHRLGLYHAEVERIKREDLSVKLKQDLVASGNLEREFPDWPVWSYAHGHPPGIPVGRTFVGRGELMAAGVMSLYYQGISQKKGEPAHGICLSGGYEDDSDQGHWFIYTGQGGRDQRTSQQVKDQEWRSGNQALRRAFEEHLPIRVARGRKEDGVQSYSYDGLYAIVKAERVPGQNGFMVCRFWMVGLPGHFNRAAKRVSFLALRGFRSMQLASDDDQPAAAPRQPRLTGTKRDASKQPKEAKGKGKQRSREATPAAAPARKRQPPHVRPGFLLDDVSGGKEKVKIPVFNDVDSEPAPADFTYLRESFFGGPAAADLARRAAAAMPSGGQWCGRDRGTFYTRQGLMKCTQDTGVWECCSGCSKAACQRNRVVATGGIGCALEVFRTVGKGWGLRSPERVPAGCVVCCYEGEVILNSEAEARQGADSYLFDLCHFVGMHADPTTSDTKRGRLPPLPAGVDSEEGEHLVVDALRHGSVARFVNHSCDPNLVVQPVLVEGGSALKYKLALVACREIAPLEELSYNYNYKWTEQAESAMQCNCGAAGCRGRLR